MKTVPHSPDSEKQTFDFEAFIEDVSPVMERLVKGRRSFAVLEVSNVIQCWEKEVSKLEKRLSNVNYYKKKHPTVEQIDRSTLEKSRSDIRDIKYICEQEVPSELEPIFIRTLYKIILELGLQFSSGHPYSLHQLFSIVVLERAKVLSERQKKESNDEDIERIKLLESGIRETVASKLDSMLAEFDMPFEPSRTHCKDEN